MKIRILSRPDHSLDLYEGLIKRHIETELMTFGVTQRGGILNLIFPNQRSIEGNVNLKNNFSIIHQMIKVVRRRYPSSKWISLERKIASYILNPNNMHGQPDLIHYWPYWYSDYVSRKMAYTNACFLGDFHEAYPGFMKDIFSKEYDKRGYKYNFPIKWDYNEAFNIAPKIVVPSKFVKDTYLNIDPGKDIKVCEFGLYDMDKNAKRVDVNNREIKFVFVGKVSLEKGVGYILDALKLLKSEYISVDFFGSINETTKDFFQSSGMNVSFKGSVDKKKLMVELKSYDALILPSLSDAYSLSVMEAQSLGLPVIVSNNTGNAEFILNSEIGLVCEAMSASSLAENMEIMTSSRIRQKFIDNLHIESKKTLKNNYTLKMINLYQECINESSIGCK